MSQGRIGQRLVNNDMLLLTTTGRRSGRSHTVPLLYLRDDEAVVVIASWGGRDYPPDWYSNLAAGSRVTVQIRDSEWTGRAEVLAEPDRSQWWQRAVAAYGGYADYQARTERTIPVVRVSPER